MAFPPLTPTTRSYSSGFQPTTKHIAISGYETRVTTGSQITQRRLEMTFENISDSHANSIEKLITEKCGVRQKRSSFHRQTCLALQVWRGEATPGVTRHRYRSRRRLPLE